MDAWEAGKCSLYPQSSRAQIKIKNAIAGSSLEVQWLGFCAFTAKGPGSIPGRGAKIPQATQRVQKKKKRMLLL